jgi:hypothetical protein
MIAESRSMNSRDWAGSRDGPSTSPSSGPDLAHPREGGATRILYCHCAYANIVPAEVKRMVLDRLAGSGAEFDAVPDLCEMAARGDERLKAVACGQSLRIAACYPRAVRWLFAAGGAPLPERGVKVLNMRMQSADEVIDGLFEPEPSPAGQPLASGDGAEAAAHERPVMPSSPAATPAFAERRRGDTGEAESLNQSETPRGSGS